MPLSFDDWDPDEHHDKIVDLKKEVYGVLQQCGTAWDITIPKLASADIHRTVQIALHIRSNLRAQIAIILLTDQNVEEEKCRLGIERIYSKTQIQVAPQHAKEVLQNLSDESREVIVHMVEYSGRDVIDEFTIEYPDDVETVIKNLEKLCDHLREKRLR